jgi:hypothetical protein
MRFRLSPRIHTPHPKWKLLETGYATCVKCAANLGQVIIDLKVQPLRCGHCFPNREAVAVFGLVRSGTRRLFEFWRLEAALPVYRVEQGHVGYFRNWRGTLSLAFDHGRHQPWSARRRLIGMTLAVGFRGLELVGRIAGHPL